MKQKYLSLLCNLVDCNVITEWQAGYLTALYFLGSKDYSFYKLSKFIYSNLREDLSNAKS